MAILRKLRPEEVAVLDAIITLRLNSDGDVFEYNYKEVQKHLIRNDDSRKYIITPDIQCKIVMNLSNTHIIDMDMLIDRNFISNYRFAQNPNYTPIKTIPEFSWLNHTDWAYEQCQLGGIITAEEAYNLNRGATYIKMTKKEASMLKSKYIDNHEVQLKLNTNNQRLYIKINEEQDWKKLPTFHSDTVPYKIIECAWKNSGKQISLGQMCKIKIIDEGTSKKYMSAIFLKNSTIKALNPKLIDLGPRSIIFRKSAIYSYDELYDLRAILKI